MVDITLESVSVGFASADGDGRVQVLDDLTLHVESGELLAVVGPSGAGKSMVLRVIAGLQRPDSGVVRIDGDIVNEQSPGERDVAMVPQSATLLTHLNVEDNLGFALRLRNLSQGETSARVHAEARVLGLWSKLRRRPRTLSSGQRRMTALGRATTRAPRAFLFDEPLAGLDAIERDRVRRQLRQVQRGMAVTTVYVTHDQRDAMALADRVAIMDRGRVIQVGAPLQLYADPADLFVARFFGSPPMGILTGRFEDDGTTGWVDVDGTVLRLHPSQRTAVLHHGVHDRLVVGLRTPGVRLDDEGPLGDWERRLPLVIARLEPLGSSTNVALRSVGSARAGSPLYASVPPTRHLDVGDEVTVTLDLREALLFDERTGARIFPPRAA